MPTFEIRIPTYKRPGMLRRALRSLQEQTETDWVAFVFDDSPLREGEAVTTSLSDERVHYRCNVRNLGAAENIDQVFRKKPHTDARFFKILSDDNYLLPNFLKRSRDIAERTGCKLLLINEIVVDEFGNQMKAGATTRDDWFPPGLVSPFSLYATLFLKEGISDGGLVWSKDAVTDLEVGQEMSEVCLQEACRTLKVVEPIYFEPEPCAAFSFLPPEKVVRQTAGNRVVSRGKGEIARYLRKRGGQKMIAEAVAFAQRIGEEAALHQTLESALRPWDGKGVGRRDWYWRLRGFARTCVTPNPVGEFLKTRPGVF